LAAVGNVFLGAINVSKNPLTITTLKD
jgi:hypothetical protein